jgi:hypothetical protein
VKYYSLNKKSNSDSFKEALIKGIAPDKGLYYPQKINPFKKSFIQELKKLSNTEIAYECLRQFTKPDISDTDLINIIEKTIDFYGNEDDLLIVISSSGCSENMLNAVVAARRAKFHSVITLSGFAKDNPLNQLGDVNLWINSNAYNFIENTHQIWLLAIVDLLIAHREHPA